MADKDYNLYWDYTLWDFIKIPFCVSPCMAALRVIDKIIYALIPSLQVLITAYFIDTSIKIVSGEAVRAQILTPLALLILLISHQYINYALMGLVRSKLNLKLTEAFRTAITDKRAMLLQY